MQQGRSEGTDDRRDDEDVTPSMLDGLIELLARLEPEQRRTLLAESTALAPRAIATVDELLAAGARGPDLAHLLGPALGGDAAERLLLRLGELEHLGATRERFRDAELLGRGGMGEVVSSYDAALRREVALKTLRGDAFVRGGVHGHWIRRFVDEAQITAQLEHPGIPPVHDIGVDREGRPFFAMQRVRGRSFGEVLGARAEGVALDGQTWTLERVVDVLRRAGEAVAYAHSRGVLHRDLKPDNVMVGEFGAVHVVDWGLARVFGDDEAADNPHAPPPTLGTDRTELADAPHATQAGTVLGTLQYMAPEQARPDAEAAGPAIDVYALGAILYRVLSGHAPYGATGTATQGELLEALRDGAPEPIDDLAPSSPPELRSICARAMRRDPARRYPSVAALVADLDAYLEHRVVRAHRTGPVVELAKWVERNRSLATASAVGLVVALFGLVGWRTGAVRAEQSERRLELTERSKLMLELPAEVELLAAEARALLPLHPRHEPALLALRARAEALAGSERARALVDEFEAELSAAGEADRALTPGGAAARRAELAELIRRAERTVEVVGSENFASSFLTDIEAWRDELARLAAPEPGGDADARPRVRAAALERVLDAHAALAGLREAAVPLADPSRPTHETQLALIARMRELQASDAARAAWERARAVWADPEGPYAASDPPLEVDPRLMPLGPDPDSGLLEFAHLATGAVPARGADGRLALDADSAVVLVALPGAALYVGAVREGRGNVDPLAEPREGPCLGVMLWSFLIAKHEVTQAQFRRLTGTNPSAYAAGGPGPGESPPIDGRHPVESVSWSEARRALAPVGLRLPTSAQWEYAARAGSTTPWTTGAAPESLAGRANLFDRDALTLPDRPPTTDSVVSFASTFEDPWPIHAPVGSFPANGFGLHDVHGNVWEWCEDAYHPYDGRAGNWLMHGRGELAFFDELAPDDDAFRVSRGGSFSGTANDARVSRRATTQLAHLSENLGLRAAMEFERPLD